MSNSSAMFNIKAAEVSVRKRFLICEALEYKELELRHKICAAEIALRTSKLEASAMYIKLRCDVENLMIDEQRGRQYIAFVCATSTLEWKSLIKKSRLQATYLEKRNAVFSLLFEKWVASSLLQRISSEETSGREFGIEMQEESRRSICRTFVFEKTKLERAIVENEEETARHNSLSSPEFRNFSLLMQEEETQRKRIYGRLFEVSSANIFLEEETRRHEIALGGLVGEDCFYSQLASKFLAGQFRILARTEIVAQHRILIESFTFNALVPLLERTERRERIFLAAQEENAWQNHLIEKHHLPAFKRYVSEISILCLQRVCRGYLVGRWTLYQNEYLRRLRDLCLQKIENRERCALLVQIFFRAKLASRTTEMAALGKCAALVFSFFQSKLSERRTARLHEARTSHASRLIQRVGRGLFSREEMYELHQVHFSHQRLITDRLNCAALVIQQQFRNFQGKRKARELKASQARDILQAKAAISISKTFKMYTARKSYRANRFSINLLRSSLLIQRVMRGARVRQFLHLILRCRLVQTFIRRYISSQITFNKIAHPAAISIQCAFRVFLARRQLERERVRRRLVVEDSAVRVIARALRKNHSTVAYQRELAEKAQLVQQAMVERIQTIANQDGWNVPESLQRIGRGHLGRLEASRLRNQLFATVTLVQRHLMAKLSESQALNALLGQRLEAEKASKNAFSTIIQTFCRGWISLKVYVGPKALEASMLLANANTAARLLQRVLRGVAARRLAHSKLSIRTKATVWIQTELRAKLSWSVFATRELAHREKQQAESRIFAEAVISDWLLIMCLKKRIASKTIQRFYHQVASKLQRMASLRSAREGVFRIQRREIEKQAFHSIELDVVRLEREAFFGIMKKSQAGHFIKQPRLEVELGEELCGREEHERVLIAAACVAVFHLEIMPAYLALRKLLEIQARGRIQRVEEILRKRIISDQFNLHRSLNIFNRLRLRHIYAESGERCPVTRVEQLDEDVSIGGQSPDNLPPETPQPQPFKKIAVTLDPRVCETPFHEKEIAPCRRSNIFFFENEHVDADKPETWLGKGQPLARPQKSTREESDTALMLLEIENNKSEIQFHFSTHEARPHSHAKRVKIRFSSASRQIATALETRFANDITPARHCLLAKIVVDGASRSSSGDQFAGELCALLDDLAFLAPRYFSPNVPPLTFDVLIKDSPLSVCDALEIKSRLDSINHLIFRAGMRPVEIPSSNRLAVPRAGVLEREHECTPCTRHNFFD